MGREKRVDLNAFLSVAEEQSFARARRRLAAHNRR
jgi:DNA-binding transcriptional LysR family regulator